MGTGASHTGTSGSQTGTGGSDTGTGDGGPDLDASYMGLVGCDGGGQMVAYACALSIPLSGPLSGTYANFPVCSGVAETVSWANSGTFELGVGISFMGQSAPVDQLGTFPLASLTITQAVDGGSLIWSADACTVTIQGSICSPYGAFTNRRVIDGTGTCSQPAEPILGNSEGPITIGDFKFLGFTDPM